MTGWEDITTQDSGFREGRQRVKTRRLGEGGVGRRGVKEGEGRKKSNEC